MTRRARLDTACLTPSKQSPQSEKNKVVKKVMFRNVTDTLWLHITKSSIKDTST